MSEFIWDSYWVCVFCGDVMEKNEQQCNSCGKPFKQSQQKIEKQKKKIEKKIKKEIEQYQNEIERYQQYLQVAGWICPNCQRIYSPFVMECPYCNMLVEQEEFEQGGI